VTPKSLAHSFVLAWGLRRTSMAFVAGAASALALAPINAWPILFLTFPALVWLVDGAVAARWNGALTAAGIGWCFGFGYFLAGLYWVGEAFLVDAQTFGWLLPFAVTLLPAGLAVFTALGVGAARLFWIRGAARLLALAAALTIAEWLRGHVLSGFPWNLFGYALTQPLVMAQSASLIGIWGLTFVAIAVFASPAVLADDPMVTRQAWRVPAAAVLVLIAFAVFGALRLAGNPTSYVAGVKLRIMQPNLQQDEKFNYNARHDVMARYLRLSDRPTAPQSNGVHDVTHLIWPESAFPFFLTREAEAMGQIERLLQPNTVLITGAIRAPEMTPNAGVKRAYNSIYAIDHDGSILGIYDKVHLVPFGEYLPLQNFLERLGLMQLTKLPGGFIPGDRRRLMSVPKAPPFVPLLCYEIIFPGAVLPSAERPGWMLNLTNDGWFGISSGPYQHFQQARLRAIEEGLPLVRAANTGISAVVDPLGRVVKSLPLGVEGVLDAGLPRALLPTVYARIGDTPLLLFLVVSFGVVGRARLRRKS